VAIPVVAALLAGCGSDSDSSDAAAARTATTVTSTPAAARAPSRPARPGARVTVRRSRYGRMLFDGKGRALYLFTHDRGRSSRCYGACARAWPPFYTDGRPLARAGVDQRLLGTTHRAGGRLQVTYRGRPLYYYVTDTAPGQVTCQNVSEYGGLWLVVAPSGRAIR
jgi:predicted lipoprotein with Yx(FWY)xxD motif